MGTGLWGLSGGYKLVKHDKRQSYPLTKEMTLTHGRLYINHENLPLTTKFELRLRNHKE